MKINSCIILPPNVQKWKLFAQNFSEKFPNLFRIDLSKEKSFIVIFEKEILKMLSHNSTRYIF